MIFFYNAILSTLFKWSHGDFDHELHLHAHPLHLGVALKDSLWHDWKLCIVGMLVWWIPPPPSFDFHCIARFNGKYGIQNCQQWWPLCKFMESASVPRVHNVRLFFTISMTTIEFQHVHLTFSTLFLFENMALECKTYILFVPAVVY